MSLQLSHMLHFQDAPEQTEVRRSHVPSVHSHFGRAQRTLNIKHFYTKHRFHLAALCVNNGDLSQSFTFFGGTLIYSNSIQKLTRCFFIC